MDKIEVKFLSLYNMKQFQSFVRPYLSLCGWVEGAKGELCQLESWATCRETIVNYVRGKYNQTPYNTKVARLTTDKTRVLTYLKHTARSKAEREGKRLLFVAALENAVKILNFFEEMGHLKRSKLYEVEHPLPSSHFIYLIEGSPEWQRAPALLSLYLLLIRCGRFPELGNFTTFEGFMKKCRFVIEDFDKHTKGKNYHEKLSYPSAFPTGSADDTKYLKLIANKLPILMKDRKKLFSRTKAEGHFKNCSSADGISNLCYGNIKNEELSDRFVEVCDSYEIEANKPFM